MPVKVFGERGAVRDYLYVSDLASGIVSALVGGRLSETYNLGSGIGLSNLDVIEKIKPLMNRLALEVKIEYLPERAFDVKVNVLDSTKLREHAGWMPQVEFYDGLERTCNWLRNYHG
jgi:UDP-glucose 4-epimerase